MEHPQNASDTGHKQLDVYIRVYEDIPRFLWKELPVAYLALGIVLNIILIYYLIRSGRWRTPLFTLITSLAFEDLLTCIACSGWATLFPLVMFPEVSFTCQLLWFTGVVGTVGSNYHLVFFAALRFFQLGFPLAARARVTCSFIIRICLLIWISMIIYMLPIGLLTQPKEVLIKGEVVTVCGFVADAVARDTVFFILNTIFPIFAIAILHVCKYIMVSRSKASMEAVQHDRKNTDARAVSIVIILFFIAWIPGNIYAIIQHRRFASYQPYQDNLYVISMFLIASNSTANPIVYCIASSTVRKDLVKFMCSRQHKHGK